MVDAEASPFRVVLRRYRIAAGLSQQELAERAGLSLRAISDLERGVKTRPRPYTARQIADALQLPAVERVAFLETASGVVAQPASHDGVGIQPTEARGSPHLVSGAFLGSLPTGALVARDDELAHMLASIDAVLRGEGRLIMLAGEPGVGKTRLAQEVTVAVRDRGFLLATGRCYDGQRSAALSPFLEVMVGLQRAAPPALGDAIVRRWPYLVRLLPDGLEGSSTSERPEDPRRLYWALTGFVSALAEIAPVALLFDDLHWADSESIDLLVHLARHTHDRRVLLLGTFREREADHPHPLHEALYELDREGLLHRIPVRRLHSKGTAALTAVFMGSVQAPADLAQLIHERTDGNAFFVQQVVRDLMERRAAAKGHTDWTITLPESVRAAIRFRVARLPEPTREALGAASVLGQTFFFDDLLAMTGKLEPELEASLRDASAAGLVREGDADSYTFDHFLTQQALYEDLPGRERRKLHLAAGTALEGLPEQQRNRRAAELAWHFRRAMDAPRAFTWTMRAGELAEEVFAWGEAERHYRTALELVGESVGQVQEAKTWERLGTVLQGLARHDEALAALEQAAALYHRQRDRDGEGRVVARIGRVHVMHGTPEEGVSRISPVLDALAASGSPPSLSALWAALADLNAHLGRWEAQLEAANRAVESAASVRDLAQAHVERGVVLTFLLRSGDAVQALQEAARLAEEIGDLTDLHKANQLMVGPEVSRGRFPAAVDAGKRTFEVAERLYDPDLISLACSSRAQALLWVGRWDDAAADIERALSLGRQIGAWDATAFALLQYGHLCIFRGDLEEAGRALEECADMVERSGDLFLLNWAQRLLAQRDVLMGDPQRALQRLTPLLQRAKERGAVMDVYFMELPLIAAYMDSGQLDAAERLLDIHMSRPKLESHPPALANACLLRAKAAILRAGLEEARSALQQGMALAQSMPQPMMQGQILVTWAELHAREGRPDLARERLQAALDIFRRLGARLDSERAEQALRSLPQKM